MEESAYVGIFLTALPAQTQVAALGCAHIWPKEQKNEMEVQPGEKQAGGPRL